MPNNPSISNRPVVKLRLENFRLFRDSGWFKLAPLTCLVGRNSSGKSSVLSAILLLKQSVEQQGMMRGAVTPLALAGPYCDLGNYADVVYDHDESSQISLSFSIPLSNLGQAFHGGGVPLVNLVGRRWPARLSYYPRIWGDARLPRRGEAMARLSFSADEPFGPSLTRLETAVGSIGSASFVRTTSGGRHRQWNADTNVLPSRSLKVSFPPPEFFPLAIHQGSYARSAPRTKRHVRTFATACDRLFHFVNNLLLASDVVGPFRTPPERRYPFGGFSSARGGPSGEQAVNLLITEALLNPHGGRPLRAALAFWIKHLKLADSLDVRDLAKRLNLFEVNVTGAGHGATANLADVGFGISQVLPVLVQGLLMQRGGVYLVQEPEIHLHPDAQAGLADFFIYLASYGVTTVVETHSEYLLLRLRRRLAEGGQADGRWIVDRGQPCCAADERRCRNSVHRRRGRGGRSSRA